MRRLRYCCEPEDAPTERIIDVNYARHYAEMLRRNPAHYLGVLSVGDLREIYLHDCLSLEELERFAGDAFSRQEARGCEHDAR